MKKLLIIIIALALAGAGAWALFGKSSKKSRRNGAQTANVTRGTISQTVEATGSIVPMNRVEIKPPMAGRMEKLLVHEGDKVVEGQTLAWMSSSDRAAILDAAKSKGPEEVTKWEDDYKATPIIAPLSGAIILENVVVGETIDASQVVYAMSDYLIVLAQVDESDIGQIRKGMKAVIKLDSYPDKSVEGSVFDILYEGKNVSNVITYGVKVKVPQVPPFFRSQMTANISFIVKSKENAVLVPVNVVKETPEGAKYVSLPGTNGKAEARVITTGIESNDQIEVTSGLEPGDKILLTASAYVPQQGPQSSPLAITPPSRRSASTSKTRNNTR
jgi:macrolide-specific efflux system membrane fusion protein